MLNTHINQVLSRADKVSRLIGGMMMYGQSGLAANQQRFRVKRAHESRYAKTTCIKSIIAPPLAF